MENENKLNFWKTLIIGILLLIAILVTVDLAYIYYQANFNEHALPSFCAINEFIDCDGVAKTVESQFFGVPLAYWGLFLYSFMTMLLAADWLKKFRLLKFLEVFKNKFHYIATLGLISFIISMVLLAVSLEEIHKLCIMCAVTYVLNLIIGIVAVIGIKMNFIGAIKQSCIDFWDALKPLPYRIAFIIVMICAGFFLYWADTTAQFSPALKFKRSFGEFVSAKYNPYPAKGNVLGSKSKDAVILEVYSDFRCPICYTNNIIVHKVIREFKNVRVEHHNMPLDMECNKYMRGQFHVGSCINARYALAARNQGKFWEVENLLFDKPAYQEEAIIQNIKDAKLGINIEKLKKDAKSKEISEDIAKDIDFCAKKGMMGTPSMKIGDDFQMGVKGYPQLKEWLIKHGGKTKYQLFK